MITIAIQGGQATYSIIGRPSPQEVIQALDVVREDILVAVAKQEAQQEVVPQGDEQEGPFHPEMLDVAPQDRTET